MRRAWPMLLALAGCSAAPPASGGETLIVSTNPCSDAILVELVPPERIAAISHYSHDPGASSIPAEVARRHRGIAGTAEEVIALRPGLAIMSTFESAATRDALRRAGIRTLALDMPTTIEQSRAQIRRIADAVGARARGVALIGRIDAAVRRTGAKGAPLPALVWHGGGLVSGKGVLIDELMTHTGFSNVSARYGISFTGILPLERVILDPPRVMLTPPAQRGADDDTRRRALRHRALARLEGAVEAAFPENLSYCGGPTIIRALDRLSEIRREIAA